MAVFGFSLSMAFRRRWRLKTDVIAFYILMLALMTPAFLVGLGNQLLWRYMGQTPSLWYTALGANVVWGIPFSFLVMLAVWNRYDRHIEEAARDLGANATDHVPGGDAAARLDGHLRQLPVRLHPDLERLRPHDPAPERLPGAAAADPDRHLAVQPADPPNLYALGAGTTAVTLFLIFVVLVAVTLRLRFRGAPVRRVEEEFGDEVGGSLDAAQAAKLTKK